MLEIKNLTKIYKTKGGTDTKALDNVTLTFDQTGMVFLLGKSGSGKSTLLNIAGGLDEPTSGEIVVMGKSSKEFSGGDFDSYRNTYVGFVFQEYNILNEFNVEDNIALALELQGKKKDADKIKSLLEEVDLAEYAKRKPNTLSGGQKQRIAIARALIKDPQIIMADEPTGALDSVTGKQVLETLKKLSATRLVMVVSHDREFAETYGDRIVELKDGKVLSDVSKVSVSAEQLTDNIVKLGDDTVTVKKGAKLNHDELAALQQFITDSDGDVLVSKSSADIATFKRVSRIDDAGRRERFSETPVKPNSTYNGAKASFIRSKLPANKAFRIGASGLKLKPFRLVLTILLCVVSFVMFGLFSTMMLYNGNKVLELSLISSDYTTITLRKQYAIRITYPNESRLDHVNYSYTQFTPKEVENWGADAFGAYYVQFATPGNVVVDSQMQNYYRPLICKIAVLPSGHPLRSKIAGNYPTDDNSIVVSSYFLECVKNAQYKALDENDKAVIDKKINSEWDLIGEHLMLMDNSIQISGVIDSGEIPEKYDSLKNGEFADYDYGVLQNYLQYLQDSIHTVAFVTEEFVERYAGYLGLYYYQEEPNYFDYNYENTFELYPTQWTAAFPEHIYELRVYQSSPTKPQLPVLLTEELDSLTGNQIIISAAKITSLYDSRLAYLESHLDEISYDELQQEKEALNKFSEQYELFTNKIVEEYTEFENGFTVKRRPATEEEVSNAKDYVVDYLKTHKITLNLFMNDVLLGEAEVVGIFVTNEYYYNNYNSFYCSQELFDKSGTEENVPYYYEETNYKLENDAQYDYVIIPYDRSERTTRHILGRIEVYDDATDIGYIVDNNLYTIVGYTNDTVESLSTVFLWVGLALALFASLLLFNFISLSITNKKKEIGILRAVGARGVDVFKIFFAESCIIVAICIGLAIVGTAVVATALNGVLKADAGLAVSLFVFGPLPILLMILLAAFVAAISTFLPVYFASKKKPVESIRAL